MTKFIELQKSGRQEKNQFGVAKLADALGALQEECRKSGRLRAEGVWRLHREEATKLEERIGDRPPGGWRALCSLAVGTGILRADEEAFVEGPVSVEELCGHHRKTRASLVEAFTCWLIPPSTAAGLFLAMDVHPLWGLRLARRLHLDAPNLDGPLEGWRDEALLPDEDLAELRKGVFAALSIILSGLRRLSRDRRYGLAGLIGFVSEAMAYGRNQIDERGSGLEVIVGGTEGSPRAASRSLEFAARELCEGVLVPAGVMRRYDDETFAVDASALEEVQVGHLGRDAQRSWFHCFLVDSGCDAVA